MSQTLPVLEVSGSPTERGLAHGEAFKDLIQDLVAANLKKWCMQHRHQMN